MPESFAIRAGIVVLAAAAWAGGARAAIVPYTQLSENREISVSSTVTGPDGLMTLSDGETSNATGTFFRSMGFEQSGQSNDPATTPHSAVSANQGVVFGDTSIFGSAGLNLRISGNPTAAGEARTLTDTQFTVAQPTPYTLSGRARMNVDMPRAFGMYGLSFTFTGTGPAGETEQIASLVRGSPPTAGFGATIDEPLSASGTLLPGWTYRLIALVQTNSGVSRFFASEQFADGTIDFAVTVPEPGGAIGLGVLAACALPRRRGLVTAA